MRHFLSIKFLIFIALLFNNSFCSNTDEDVARSGSFVSIASGDTKFFQEGYKHNQNRRKTGKWSGWNAADLDEEWTVTKGVLIANTSPLQAAKIQEFVQVDSPQTLKQRRDLLKILVLGPVEKSIGPTAQKERLQGKAILMELTNPDDRISLIDALQKKSPPAAAQALQQAQNFLNQNTNIEDRALIARSFASFEDPSQGEAFAEDLTELKKSKRLNGKMIFHAAQAWKEDRLELLRSWKSLMSFEDLRHAKDRVIESFLRLPSTTRKVFLGLLPKGLSPSRHKVRGIHKILEAEGDLESKIQKIEGLSNLQEQAPEKYDRFILTIDREAPLALSSDEASSSEDERSGSSRVSLRKKFVKRSLPSATESEESGQYSESGEE